MNDRILAVTCPDDVLTDGFRLLLVDLTEPQMNVISQALYKIEEFSTIVVYIWKNNDDSDWMLDKKHKSDLIIFNADSNNQTIVGYMAAQSKSCYIGTLKDLNKANTFVIHDVQQAIDILEKSL